MFLIDKFQQFYGEVLRLRGRVAEGSWVFQGDTAANEPRESPSGVWRKLVGLLERQSLDAGREGGDFGLEVYRRAQYAMAAPVELTSRGASGALRAVVVPQGDSLQPHLAVPQDLKEARWLAVGADTQSPASDTLFLGNLPEPARA